MKRRYVEGTTPTLSVDVYWSARRKRWFVRASAADGRPLGAVETEGSAPLDDTNVALLLRAVRAELEAQLPL